MADGALVPQLESRVLDRHGLGSKRTIVAKLGRYVAGVAGGSALSLLALAIGATPVGLTLGALALLGPPALGLVRWAVDVARGAALATATYRMARSRERATVADVPVGRWVHVRGRVQPGAAFTSAGGRSNVVLAAYVGAIGTLERLFAAWRWELHGVDFAVALDSGERVRVSVAHATYVDRPITVPREIFLRQPYAVHTFVLPPRDDPWAAVTDQAGVHAEEVVAVGDEVEVLGLLEREVDPAADAGFRGARLAVVLHGRRPWRLLIRKARPARG